MNHDHRTDGAEPVDRREPWAEGDWRWNVGRLRAAGRHDPADRLEGRFPFPIPDCYPPRRSMTSNRADRPVEAARRRGAMTTTKVNPTEVYSAHVGGNGDAGIVAATIPVHRPTGRTVETWTTEDEVVLGEPVSDLEARGYTVTPRAAR